MTTLEQRQKCAGTETNIFESVTVCHCFSAFCHCSSVVVPARLFHCVCSSVLFQRVCSSVNCGCSSVTVPASLFQRISRLFQCNCSSVTVLACNMSLFQRDCSSVKKKCRCSSVPELSLFQSHECRCSSVVVVPALSLFQRPALSLFQRCHHFFSIFFRVTCRNRTGSFCDNICLCTTRDTLY